MANQTITDIRAETPAPAIADTDYVLGENASKTIAWTIAELRAAFRPGVATTSANGLMSSGDKTKLNGIANNATANDTDAALKSRANHTGSQPISTITDLASTLTAFSTDIDTAQADIVALQNGVEALEGDVTAVEDRVTMLEAPKPVVFPTYTKATLPSASTNNRACVEVSDATGGVKVVRSNGTDWLILNTNTVVS